jgi:hypothetical protein
VTPPKRLTFVLCVPELQQVLNGDGAAGEVTKTKEKRAPDSNSKTPTSLKRSQRRKKKERLTEIARHLPPLPCLHCHEKIRLLFSNVVGFSFSCL